MATIYLYGIRDGKGNEANITHYRGDDITLDVTVYDQNGTKATMTSATITFRVRTGVGGTQQWVKTVSSGITLDATNSRFTVAIADTDTSSLTPGTFYYDADVTTSSTTDTVLHGKYILVGDIA